MGIVALITTLVPLLLNLLGANGVINPNLVSLITELAAAIPNLVQSLISGKSATDDITAILKAIQVEVDALKNGTKLFTVNEVNEINAIDLGLQNALAAYTAASQLDDPSLLTPLPESFPAV